MATNQFDTDRTTARRGDAGRTDTGRAAERNPDANPDAITGAPGSHPLGTGIGAAAGGVAVAGGAIGVGALVGSAVGPVGTAIGAAVGAVVGGLVGKGVAEEVNPSVEHEYWRGHYSSRSYVRPGADYDEYGPAYQYGWEARSKYPGKTFDEVEPTLGSDWSSARSKSTLAWENARDAARDSWDRVGQSPSPLNDVIETLKDGQNGFQTAAENVTDPNIKTLFLQLSQQRGRFAAELQSHVASHGVTPEQTGSAAAAMHRGWMNVKNAFGGGDKAILNEAERGEDIAVQSYQTALGKDLPADCAALLRRQFTDIKQAHDRVRAMRDALR